jgi:hypothetical protein
VVVAQREITEFHLLLPGLQKMRQLIETAPGCIEAKSRYFPSKREFVVLTRAATVSVEENNPTRFNRLQANSRARIKRRIYAGLIRIKSARQGMIAKYVGH